MTRSTRRPSLLGSRRLASVLFVVGALAVAAPSAAQDFPEFTAPVVDQAGVVPDDAERQVNDELLSYQQRTGNQIAVAIIDTIGDASVEDYSIDLAKEWGVGSAEEDNGVLLLIAIEERKLRIEVGEGIEGDLTDLESGRIRDQIGPLLTDGEFGEAILQGTRAIRAAVGDTDAPPAAAPTEGSRPGRAFPGWLFSVIPFFIFPMLFGARRRRRSLSPVFWGGGTVRHHTRRDRHNRRRYDDDDDDGGSGWLGAAILGSILLGGGRHGGGGWGGSDSGGGGGFDFGGGGGGDFGGGGASGDW